MEREADYIGMQLTAKACFDPQEMPEVWQLCSVFYTSSHVAQEGIIPPTGGERIYQRSSQYSVNIGVLTV